MKTSSLVIACLVATLATTVLAMTIEREVTPAYVREHPEEFSVNVVRGKEGLIDFTITHHVSTPMYHVAHLAIRHQGKLIATSDTPLFGRKRDNGFFFSIAPADLSESEFNLSDSAVSGSGETAVPMVGTVIHRFPLLDFVPKEWLKTETEK
jgi:hypothetical protein